MTPILIQVLVLSTIVGTLSPAASAAHNDANTKTSYPDFPELSPRENTRFDWFNSTDDLKPEFVPGEVLVNFAGGISFRLEDARWTTGIKSIDELLERFEVRLMTRSFLNVYKLELSEDADILYAAREFMRLRNFVEYAEPNGIAHTFLVPNDANYSQQWAHQVIGSEEAWNVTIGIYNFTIAIIDSGVDYNHPDLAANIWINSEEIADNGIDDDQNGFVDDVRGWDFVDTSIQVFPGEDGTEPDNDPMDFLGHGTFSAGIVAAVTNNEIGIAGVTWNSTIMPVRAGFATYAGGTLTYDAIAAGIHYATDNGAEMISMSFGGPLRSEVVYDAVKYAYDNDVLMAGAAGNDFVRTKTYPAAYEEVIAVTATDQYDIPAYFTNFGNWVEVAAPGVDTLSTVCPNASVGPYELEYPYDYASGTSAAAPHVAGVAALIQSRFTYMTRDQVRVQLRRTAVDLSPEGFDIYYGYGRISAGEAVTQVPAEHDLLVLSWKLPFVSKPNIPVAINTTVLNFGSKGESQIQVKLLVNGIEEDSERINNLKSGNSATVSCWWTPIDEGTYNVTTYVVPAANELSNDTENNAQSAYSWVSYDKAVEVPKDFSTIQEAIETSNLRIYGGEATIQVSNGTYYEYDLLIQNMLTSLTLAGENSRTTIISGFTNFVGVHANADNVTIKGLTIQDSYVGVQLWGEKCVVSGNNLTNNIHGVSVSAYPNNTIRDNIVSGSSGPGIELEWSSGNTIINNTASSNQYGLYMGAANNTLISGNTIANNLYGIWLTTSSDNVLTNNTLTGNTYGFGVQGNSLSHFIHDVDTTNTVDEKPIYYLINQSNLVIEPSNFTNVGYLGLVNSTGITVRDLTMSKSIQGLMFAYTKDSNIQNVTASNNSDGISLFNSNNTSIVNNTLTNNYFAIYTWTSTNNTITNNTLSNDNYGIYLSNSYDHNIGNNTITNVYRGIHLYSSNNNTFESNTVTSGTYGIYMHSSNNNTFEGNTVTSFRYAVYVRSSNDNTLKANTATDSTYGIYIYSCEASVLTNNNMTENDYNFFVGGFSLAEYIHYISTSNTVNGKPMYYLLNKATLVIEPSAFPDIGYLGLVNSTNITVENVTTPTNNGQGILFAYVTDSAIQNVNASNNYEGINLFDSNKTSISDNTMSSNVYGIRITDSHNNTVDSNLITAIDKDGIYLTSSSNNTISGNTITDCGRTGYYNGIILSDSSNNTIKENTISQNKRGFRITASNDNVIYHNNINNTLQVYIYLSSNSWDNGAEGNYWSDYHGVDDGSGGRVAGDGIGDTLIPHLGVDNYPLMNLWSGLVYALNLHIMDWDLIDSIQGAYVYVDLDVKISDADGWANWTEISGAVYIKVKWYGVWVNGTFLVVVNSNKTIDIQCKIFDITVTTVEGEQGAVLQYVNVTVYNATNSMIQTAITDSEGKAYLTNVPNSTQTFTCYENGSPQQVIANVTRTITTENQAETVICDQNGVSVSQEWGIIADYNSFSLSLVPLPAIGMLNYLSINTKGLKERVKTIRSKQNKRRKEVKAKNESST